MNVFYQSIKGILNHFIKSAVLCLKSVGIVLDQITLLNVVYVGSKLTLLFCNTITCDVNAVGVDSNTVVTRVYA